MNIALPAQSSAPEVRTTQVTRSLIQTEAPAKCHSASVMCAIAASAVSVEGAAVVVARPTAGDVVQAITTSAVTAAPARREVNPR